MSDKVITFCNLGNCPVIGVNDDGSITIWDTERPDETVTFSATGWQMLVARIKDGFVDDTLTAVELA